MSVKEQNINLIKQIVKGALIATFSTIVGVLIFALIIKATNLSEIAIKSVNQFIKIISIFLGVLFSVKENKGLVKGAIVGATYMLIVSLIFRLLGSRGNGFLSFILELLFCAIVGVIFGIISVNAKNR